MRKHLVAVLALFAVLAFASVQRADAAATVLCAPNPVEQSNQRQIVVPMTGATYTLNGQGCAVVQQGDVLGLSQIGFTAGPPFGPNVLYTTGVLTGTTSVQIGTLPPSTYIQHIIVNNLTANAITGGVTFGSSSGGTDIASVALACGANCLAFEPDSSLAKRIFSTTGATPIFMQAATSWNSANVTISIIFGYF